MFLHRKGVLNKKILEPVANRGASNNFCYIYHSALCYNFFFFHYPTDIWVWQQRGCGIFAFVSLKFHSRVFCRSGLNKKIVDIHSLKIPGGPTMQHVPAPLLVLLPFFVTRCNFSIYRFPIMFHKSLRFTQRYKEDLPNNLIQPSDSTVKNIYGDCVLRTPRPEMGREPRVPTSWSSVFFPTQL